jgi:ABC-type branched-subunit amino acid transport system substrate-binding protein
MKKTRIFSLGLALFLLAGLSLVTTQVSADANLNAVEPNQIVLPERKLGLLTPLSGTLGSLGVTFVTAANLAIDDLNTKYPNYNFTLVIQDTQSDTTATTNAATALVGQSVLGVAGAARSAGTIAAEAVLTAASIPLVSYASTSPALTTLSDSGYLFRVVPSDALQGIAAAKLVEFAGITSVATIGINDAYGQGLVDAFLLNSGLTPTTRVDYDLTQTDFSSEATTIVNGAPDAVYMASFIDDGAAILNALELQGFEGPIIGADGISSPTMFDVAGVNSSMHLTMGTAPTFAATSDFTAKYNDAIGNDPTIFVAEAYDAISLLGEAVMNATTTGAGVRDALSVVGSSYDGAYSSNDTGGDLVGGNYDVWQVQTTAGDADLVVTGNFNPGTNVLTVWDNMNQTDWITANTNVIPAPVVTTTTTETPTTATSVVTSVDTDTVTATATAPVSVSTKTESPLLFSVFFIGIVSAVLLVRFSKRQ